METRHQETLRELKRARESLRLSQSDVAGRLGWSTSKISRLEAGQLALSVEDLERLSDVLGISVLRAFTIHQVEQDNTTVTPASHAYWRAPKEVDPEMLQPGLILEEQVNSGPGRSLLPLAERFFPLGRVIRVVDGAEVPRKLLAASKEEQDQKLEEARGWLLKDLGRRNIGKEKLEGMIHLPALTSGDLRVLVKPRPTSTGPVAPRLKTRLRGPWMAIKEPRLVVDPGTLMVTVVTTPMLVLLPLRLLMVRTPFSPAGGEDDCQEEHEEIVFRVAGLLASAFVQQWMQEPGRVWFTPSSGPFRDVPVPSRLWDISDRPAKRLGALAQEHWRSRQTLKASTALFKELNSVVQSLMMPLRSSA